MRPKNALVSIAIGLLIWAPLACSDEDASQPLPEVIEDLELSEEIPLTGLGATVEVVVDSRGIPHIYAAEPVDAIRAQGYLMAIDRMAQMDFLRRVVHGRLAELIGSISAEVVENERFMRIMGFSRQAQAILDSIQTTEAVRPSYKAPFRRRPTSKKCPMGTC